MPRHPRKYSNTGIYHIMLRGNERKNIFIDDQDKERIIEIIIKNKANDAFKLYAYCIMGNHLHMVLQEQKVSISKIIKKIATSYAYYFNKKYNRVGHIFQDRFKSEAIEDEGYLLQVIRYIHNNPEKAAISKKEQYKWSSYPEYIAILNSPAQNPEIIEILKIFSSTLEIALKEFIRYSQRSEEEKFMEIESTVSSKIDEKKIQKFIYEFLLSRGIKKKDLKKRENKSLIKILIQQLTNDFNLSKRKVAYLTGVNREKIRKLSKEPSP